MPNWKKVIVSGSDASLNSLFVLTSVTGSSFRGSFTGSLFGTASWAQNFITSSVTSASYAFTASSAISSSFSSTASFVTTLNQNVVITGSLTVGSSSVGSNENTLILGPSPAGGAGEGGQLLLQAPGGIYTSASMWDNWQNQTRLLRGTNAGSDAVIASFNMHTKQVQFPAYNATNAFTGTTLVGLLGFDSNGNLLTTTTSSGGGGGVTITNNTDNYILTATGVANSINGESNLQFNGSTLSVTGNVTAAAITSSGAIIAQANGAMYFRGGDDAELWDINVVNTVGLYGQQDQTVGSLKLGSNGGTISGRSGSIGIGTTNPNSASLHVNGNVFASSFTGSLFGTSSWAQNALTASYAINITVSGSIEDVDYINFDTSSAFTNLAGRLGWDSGEGTLQLGLAGGNVQLSVGTQLYQYVYNAETSSLSKGQIVFISGSQGNRIAVKLADNSSDRFSAGTLGFVAETITAGGTGWIMTEGPLRKLNTLGLTGGSLLFLGETPGTYTETKPIAPRHEVRVGYVERVDNTVGSIYVKIDNGYEIGELHDVVDTTTTSSYGDLLVKSGSVWINSKSLTGSYSLTGSLNATSITASSALINGTITAQTLVVSTISSSIVYSSGSNIFGNSTTNTQTFTGSVNVTGSLNVNGRATINDLTGSIFGTASWAQNALTSSFALTASSADNFLVRNNAIVSGSFTVFTGSAVELQVTNTGVKIGNMSTDQHNVTGSFRITGSLIVTGSSTLQTLTASAALISGSGTQRLTVVGSGSAQPLFTVLGSQGELFSITDSLSGSLFSVNDISGLPIFEVFSDSTTLIGSYSAPMLITTFRTGSVAIGANTIYSLPTASYDGVFVDYTIKSGSNARAGNFAAIWTGTSVNFMDNSTVDFGNTSGFVFGAKITGGNMIVTGSATTTGWTVKTIIRSI